MNNQLFSKTAASWLQKAEDDLKWTESSLNGKIYYGACFAAQQAAEKALKAFIILKGKIPKKIHLLPALLEECLINDSSFNEIREAIKTLNSYYIPTRYSDVPDFSIYTPDQAEDALQKAKQVVEFVKKKLQ